MHDITLASITVYPLKSGIGASLPSSLVEPRGLRFDRRFMAVDREGLFYTAREIPGLLGVQLLPLDAEGGRWKLAHANREPVSFTLDAMRSERPEWPVTVWKSTVNACRISDEVDAWLSDVIGVEANLVVLPEATRRALKDGYGIAGDHVSFADGFPVLGISEAACTLLERRSGVAIDMRRFRPNLTFRGCGAHGEDEWKRVRIGAVEFENVKACDRCSLTTRDPDTGKQHAQSEPLRTLAKYRRSEDGAVYVGVNLVPRSGGVLNVGDEVEILETGGPAPVLRETA